MRAVLQQDTKKKKYTVFQRFVLKIKEKINDEVSIKSQLNQAHDILSQGAKKNDTVDPPQGISVVADLKEASIGQKTEEEQADSNKAVINLVKNEQTPKKEEDIQEEGGQINNITSEDHPTAKHKSSIAQLADGVSDAMNSKLTFLRKKFKIEKTRPEEQSDGEEKEVMKTTEEVLFEAEKLYLKKRPLKWFVVAIFFVGGVILGYFVPFFYAKVTNASYDRSSMD